jgi:hypothetical protein
MYHILMFWVVETFAIIGIIGDRSFEYSPRQN